MADRKTVRGSGDRRSAAHFGPSVTLAMLSLLAAMPIFLIGSLAPRPLVLPALSLAAVTVAAAIALVAKIHGARWDGDTVTLWDAAGAFVLVGCAAAIFSKPENVSHWFGTIVP